MQITATLQNERQVLADIDRLTAEMTGRIRGAVETAGLVIESRAKAAIQSGEKTGRIYYVRRGGAKNPIQHQASAPGEPPANLTGQLANSVHAKMVGPLTAEVSVDDEKGPWLEYGTEDGRIEPRPYFQPSVDATIPELEAELNEILQTAG
jgi:hypothetical protein